MKATEIHIIIIILIFISFSLISAGQEGIGSSSSGLGSGGQEGMGSSSSGLGSGSQEGIVLSSSGLGSESQEGMGSSPVSVGGSSDGGWSDTNLNISNQAVHKLKLEIKGTPSSANRTNQICATYTLTNYGSTNISQINLIHKLPLFFLVNKCANCSISEGLLVFQQSKLYPGASVSFRYNATILRNASIGNYYFSAKPYPKYFINNDLEIEIVPLGNTIMINNKFPEIKNKYMIFYNKTFTKQDQTYIISRTDPITFNGIARDAEDPADSLEYIWMSGDRILAKGNNTTTRLEKGFYERIMLKVVDKDGGETAEYFNESIDVRYNNINEYFSDLVTPAIIFLILLVIFILFIKELFINFWVMVSGLVMIIVSYYILYMNPIYRFTPTTPGVLELYILAGVIIYTSYFIMSSYSYNSRFANINFIDKIKSIINGKSKEDLNAFLFNKYIICNLKNLLNVDWKKWVALEQNKWGVWYLTISLMLILVSCLIFLVPLMSTAPPNDLDINYNFIFWYYSMMTQTFGAILAIIAMVATFNIGNIKTLYSSIQNSIYLNYVKIKIRNFMILYVTIIMFSIVGLAIRTVPPLQQWQSCESIAVIPLFFFETTLLLSLPALICLVKLILDLYEEMKDNENSDGLEYRGYA